MRVCLHLCTVSIYMSVKNPSVLPHNLSESQARADKTWQSSWVARRSSYQRSKQSNMRSGSQTRSVALRSCAPKLVKMMPEVPQESQKMKISLLSAPVDEHFHSRKIDCLSTLKFDTTPVKPATCTKQSLSTLTRSLYKCSLILNSKSRIPFVTLDS